MPDVWVVGVRVVAVEELDDVEAAPVHVEVDIALLEVRGHEAPDLHLRVCLFDLASGGVADAPAVRVRAGEQKLELALLTLDLHHGAADPLAVLDDSPGLALVD